MLYVADMHLGKDAIFRGHGVPVPAAAGRADLARLSTLVDRLGARSLMVLGDLLHGRGGMTPATEEAFAGFRAQHPRLEITLIRGNHDRSAGDPPASWRIRCLSEPFSSGGLLLRHEPPEEPNPNHPALAGHLHPCVTLEGRGRTRMNLPCFWLQPHVVILPAFTGLAGRPQIRPAEGDRIFVAGDEVVLEAAIEMRNV